MSLSMKLVSLYLRVAKKPKMSTAARARHAMNEPKTTPDPPPRLRDRHDVTSRRVGDFTTYTVSPRGAAPHRTVIYLHGGAYIAEIGPQHWDLVSEMADSGVRVEVPIYGLAPTHSYREAYTFLTKLYELVSGDPGGYAITVMGDSAGAGLALGFAQSLVAHGISTPERLVLISPWLDLTLTNPDILPMENTDPWLTRVGLVEAGLAWADGDDPTAEALSPIRGSLVGLPPTDIYIGTHDLFHPDVLRLLSLAGAAGFDLNVVECAGAVHVYPLVPAPEGRRAKTEIVTSLGR